MTELNEAFRKAIKEYDYEGDYQGVYPVKTNQMKEVVDQIVKAGHKYRYGLEAGSKPELMIALSMNLHPEALVHLQRLQGRDLHPHGAAGPQGRAQRAHHRGEDDGAAADPEGGQGTEGGAPAGPALQAQRHGQRASGRTRAGDHAKFGLNTQEILEAIEILEKRGMLDSIQELHFHIGSQITDIRKIKTAMKEATRMYAKLRKRGVPLQYLNVGGGLGVDYDGSRTTFSSSMNYTLAGIRRRRGLHHQGHLHPGAGAGARS